MFRNSIISSRSQEDEEIEQKLEEFVIHPLVYPTLDSLIRDIHFKTFNEFEGSVVLSQGYNLITSTDDIGKFDTHIYIVDKSVIDRGVLSRKTVSKDLEAEHDPDDAKTVASFVKQVFKQIDKGKKYLRNFTEEFVYRHVSNVNTKKLDKLEGQVVEEDDDLGDPIEMMNK